jgi:hypothetical protein
LAFLFSFGQLFRLPFPLFFFAFSHRPRQRKKSSTQVGLQGQCQHQKIVYNNYFCHKCKRYYI